MADFPGIPPWLGWGARQSMTEAEYAREWAAYYKLGWMSSPIEIAKHAVEWTRLDARAWLDGKATLENLPETELGHRQLVINSRPFFDFTKETVDLLRNQFRLYMQTAHDFVGNDGVRGLDTTIRGSLAFNVGALLKVGGLTAYGMIAGAIIVGAATGIGIGCAIVYMLDRKSCFDPSSR